MNYYEELGLEASASTEEIRQAYKSVVRLLHPDHQCEEELRKAAELQMRRLNEILSLLTDPKKRQEYDASLRQGACSVPSLSVPPGTRIPLGLFHIRFGAILWSVSLMAAAISFSSALLYFEHGAAVAVYRAKRSPQGPPRSPAPRVPYAPLREGTATPQVDRQPRRVLKARQLDSPAIVPADPRTQMMSPTEPDVAGQQVETARSQPLPTDAPASVPVVGEAPHPLESSPDQNSSPPVSLPESLVGAWLSTASSETGTGNSLAYRIEYVQMIVKSKENGEIAGTYLGRFRVPDRALSSEISFSFQGAASDGAASLTWHSDDGAEGKVRLKLFSHNRVEVTWYTTRFGTAPRLASGSSVLWRE